MRSGHYGARRALMLLAMLALGCATSVEYAPAPEEVIVRADGAPYRLPIERFAVSRDGRFVAFGAPGEPFGLADDRGGLLVYDRRSRTVRGTCEPPSSRVFRGTDYWDLSEDGRYLMVRHRRCDLETGEIVDVESFPDEAYYGRTRYSVGSIVFFKDGSGAAYQDDSIPGVRVSYYDGRPDVVIPLEHAEGSPVDETQRVFIASDRWGRHLFVSGYYFGEWREWYEREAAPVLVTLPDVEIRAVDVRGLRLQPVNAIYRPGLFSDDGSTLSMFLWRAGLTANHRIDVATLGPSPYIRYSWSSDELDDGRTIATVAAYGAGQSVFRIGFRGGVLGVVDAVEPQHLRADLSAYLSAEGYLPEAELLVTAPASHEVFLTIPLVDRGDESVLVVVPVPPREMP